MIEKTLGSAKMSRRRFIGLTLPAGAAMISAACGTETKSAAQVNSYELERIIDTSRDGVVRQVLGYAAGPALFNADNINSGREGDPKITDRRVSAGNRAEILEIDTANPLFPRLDVNIAWPNDFTGHGLRTVLRPFPSNASESLPDELTVSGRIDMDSLPESLRPANGHDFSQEQMIAILNMGLFTRPESPKTTIAPGPDRTLRMESVGEMSYLEPVKPLIPLMSLAGGAFLGGLAGSLLARGIQTKKPEAVKQPVQDNDLDIMGDLTVGSYTSEDDLVYEESKAHADRMSAIRARDAKRSRVTVITALAGAIVGARIGIPLLNQDSAQTDMSLDSRGFAKYRIVFPNNGNSQNSKQILPWHEPKTIVKSPDCMDSPLTTEQIAQIFDPVRDFVDAPKASEARCISTYEPGKTPSKQLSVTFERRLPDRYLNYKLTHRYISGERVATELYAFYPPTPTIHTRPDLRPDSDTIESVRIPQYVVWGNRNHSTPVTSAKDVEERITNSALGHFDTPNFKGQIWKFSTSTKIEIVPKIPSRSADVR